MAELKKTVLGLDVDVKKYAGGDWDVSGPNAASLKAQLAMHGVQTPVVTDGHLSVSLGSVKTAIGLDKSGVAQRILNELNESAAALVSSR